VKVRRRHQCVFEENPMTVKCNRVDDYIPCEPVGLNHDHPKSLPVGLEASLIG